MGARQRMTMRALIERNYASKDPYGQPGPPDWQIIGIDIPCYAWHGTVAARRTVIGDQQTVMFGMPGAIFPFNTDISEKDRIRSITDRLGNELFSMMYIDAIQRRRDHLGVRLRDYA